MDKSTVGLIEEFAAWVTLYETRGELKKPVHTGELWEIVGKVEKVNWELKRSLHRLAYQALIGELEYQTAIAELQNLVQQYGVC